MSSSDIIIAINKDPKRRFSSLRLTASWGFDASSSRADRGAEDPGELNERFLL
jgi:hypothetical protein